VCAIGSAFFRFVLCKRFQIQFSHWFCGRLTHNFKSVTHKIIQSTQFFYVNLNGTGMWEAPSEPISTIQISRRIPRGIPHGCSSSRPSVTMIPPSKTHPSPGKPSPPCQVCAASFESLHCVYGQKTGHFCSKFCQEKSIFVCMISGAFFCFVDSSIMMAISAYGKDCLYCLREWWWMSAILLKTHRLGKNFVKSCVVKWVIYIQHVAMDMNTFYDAKWPLIYY
jgi:hypothetical protein